MKLKTLKDIDVKGKKVLLRVDFNVPHCPEKGIVVDNTRIRAAIPTINYLQDHEAKVIIMSHRGRPKGVVVEELRLNEVAKELEKVLEHPVKKMDCCIGNAAETAIAQMQPGDVLLLENTRFHAEEEANDPGFIKKLASLGEIFVSDAFGAVHRAHASTAGLADHLPSVAGLLLEREMEILTPLLAKSERPLVLVIGGAKIDSKIGVLKSFVDKADTFLMGGALANTFLKAKGFDMGASLYQEDKLAVAEEIMEAAEEAGEKMLLPRDVVVAEEISRVAVTKQMGVEEVKGSMKVLDIGPETLAHYQEVLKKAGTIVWNGPMGLSEYKPFQAGSFGIAQAMADAHGITIIGGGDTIDVLNKVDFGEENFTHVSTGGGAMLEFLEAKVLPGIKALEE